jgi:hypothetical protein
MLRPREKPCYRHHSSAAALGVCLLAAGCAGEHLFRAQDRKIEELRLDRARQDEALGRTREIVDQLRDEWKSFASRENSASKETAALQAAIRKIAQRLEESDGKRAKLEERLHLAETKATELNQAFTQVSSMLKAAEGDLIALRSSRAAAGFPASGQTASASLPGAGREGGGKTPGDASPTADAPRGQGALGAFIEGIFSGRGPSGLASGAILLASGILVALVCVYIGSKIRAGSSRAAEPPKKPEKPEKPKTAPKPAAAPAPAAQPAPATATAGAQAAEAPAQGEEEAPAAPAAAAAADPPPVAQPASRVPAAPAHLVFPPNGVDDFFEAAENASARYSKSASKQPEPVEKQPVEASVENTQVIEEVTSDELSNTDLLPVPGSIEPEDAETVAVSVHRAASRERKLSDTGAQTELLDDAAPGSTQVIGEDEQPTPVIQKPRLDASRELLAGKQSPRNPPTPVQKKRGAPDEKDLLDELENIIGYKMGEKPG